jgi:hypothetical protein
MSNIFSYDRFRRLFIKHTIENFNSYVMAALVLCGIISLLYVWVFFIGPDELTYQTRCILFVVTYLLSGVIFTSTIFSEYGKTRTAIVSLLIPASHFEKYFVGWVYSLIIYTGVFLLCFYSIDMLFIAASRTRGNELKLLDLFSSAEKLYVYFFFYILLHGAAIYGAIFFKSLHFVRTACVFFIILFALCIFNLLLQKMLIPEDVIFSTPLNGVRFRTARYSYTGVRIDIFYHTILLWCTLAVILWASAFYRLKEKQV